MNESLNIVIHVCLFICGCYLWWRFFKDEWISLTKKWWNLQNEVPLGDVSRFLFNSLIPISLNYVYLLCKGFFQ